MNIKMKNFFWGFGSAGLNSLFYLNKKFDQNIGNALFVKNSFEKDIKINSNSSPSSKLKHNCFHELKEQIYIKKFDTNSVLAVPDIVELTNKFPCNNIFTIVGLGGSSADALLNLTDIFIHGEITNVVNFCIMPFDFEGTKRKKEAEAQLKLIKRIPNDGIVYILSNQDLLKDTEHNNTFDDAFEKLNRTIEQVILKHKTVTGKLVSDLPKKFK